MFSGGRTTRTDGSSRGEANLTPEQRRRQLEEQMQIYSHRIKQDTGYACPSITTPAKDYGPFCQNMDLDEAKKEIEECVTTGHKQHFTVGEGLDASKFGSERFGLWLAPFVPAVRAGRTISEDAFVTNYNRFKDGIKKNFCFDAAKKTFFRHRGKMDTMTVTTYSPARGCRWEDGGKLFISAACSCTKEKDHPWLVGIADGGAECANITPENVPVCRRASDTEFKPGETLHAGLRPLVTMGRDGKQIPMSFDMLRQSLAMPVEGDANGKKLFYALSLDSSGTQEPPRGICRGKYKTYGNGIDGTYMYYAFQREAKLGNEIAFHNKCDQRHTYHTQLALVGLKPEEMEALVNHMVEKDLLGDLNTVICVADKPGQYRLPSSSHGLQVLDKIRNILKRTPAKTLGISPEARNKFITHLDGLLSDVDKSRQATAAQLDAVKNRLIDGLIQAAIQLPMMALVFGGISLWQIRAQRKLQKEMMNMQMERMEKFQKDMEGLRGETNWKNDPLKAFGENLTEAAKEGKYDHLYLEPGSERWRAYESAAIKLNTGRSMRFFAKAGVGKTAFVQLLARQAAAEDPKLRTLHGREIWSINLNDLVAGTKYRGQFEERLKAVLDVARTRNAVLFIDEIHRIGTVGGTEGSSGMAEQILELLGKPTSEGGIQVIGATDRPTFKDINLKALGDRLKPIPIQPSTAAETIEMLKKVREHVGRARDGFGKIIIADDLVEDLVKRMEKTKSSVHEPRRSIFALEELIEKAREGISNEAAAKNLTGDAYDDFIKQDKRVDRQLLERHIDAVTKELAEIAAEYAEHEPTLDPKSKQWSRASSAPSTERFSAKTQYLLFEGSAAHAEVPHHDHVVIDAIARAIQKTNTEFMFMDATNPLVRMAAIAQYKRQIHAAEVWNGLTSEQQKQFRAMDATHEMEAVRISKAVDRIRIGTMGETISFADRTINVPRSFWEHVDSLHMREFLGSENGRAPISLDFAMPEGMERRAEAERAGARPSEPREAVSSEPVTDAQIEERGFTRERNPHIFAIAKRLDLRSTYQGNAWVMFEVAEKLAERVEAEQISRGVDARAPYASRGYDSIVSTYENEYADRAFENASKRAEQLRGFMRTHNIMYDTFEHKVMEHLASKPHFWKAGRLLTSGESGLKIHLDYWKDNYTEDNYRQEIDKEFDQKGKGPKGSGSGGRGPGGASPMSGAPGSAAPAEGNGGVEARAHLKAEIARAIQAIYPVNTVDALAERLTQSISDTGALRTINAGMLDPNMRAQFFRNLAVDAIAQQPHVIGRPAEAPPPAARTDRESPRHEAPRGREGAVDPAREEARRIDQQNRRTHTTELRSRLGRGR